MTNRVQVSSPSAVRDAVRDIFGVLYPAHAFDAVWIAFHDFERFFLGLEPDYHAVDTTYHDIQHTLDMTLALARLIAGHEITVSASDKLGADRASLAIITALFHDSGYLRHRRVDRDSIRGAEFTLSHVSRSASFLSSYLPRIGLDDLVSVSTQIVHFTGYEKSLDDIELDDPKDSIAGHLLGTADLIAQLADRCYLEKCRDRLFPEFILGGIAVEHAPDGTLVRYRSGLDLLAQTLRYYQHYARRRLEKDFNRAYRYAEPFFEGINPYMICIEKNLSHLGQILLTNDWGKLRRHPVCVVPDESGEAKLMYLALERIRAMSETHNGPREPDGPGTPRPAVSF
ncbi:MAG: hypothetical protein ACR2QQ_00180 [Gammaproteobacteria bacterium]